MLSLANKTHNSLSVGSLCVGFYFRCDNYCIRPPFVSDDLPHGFICMYLSFIFVLSVFYYFSLLNLAFLFYASHFDSRAAGQAPLYFHFQLKVAVYHGYSIGIRGDLLERLFLQGILGWVHDLLSLRDDVPVSVLA